MPITFRSVAFDTLDHSKLLAQWDADPTTRHLLIPHRKKDSAPPIETAEQIHEGGTNGERPTVDLMILKNGTPVGHCNMMFDPPHRITKEGKIAWLGIVIGDFTQRNQGIGKQAIRHLESLAKAQGADAIEVGVFEFNQASRYLFQSLGYEQIGRIEAFTYWQGKAYADLRFLKKIS